MNSPVRWDLQIDPGVLKTLKKVPRQYVAVLLEVIRLLPSDPFFGDIQKMQGATNAWRRRVGSYRIFYTLDFSDKRILVFRIERRTSSTYRS
jgi:mRNA-degrading endonuclease RelE of RelBE toxin-antitoxin system